MGRYSSMTDKPLLDMVLTFANDGQIKLGCPQMDLEGHWEATSDRALELQLKDLDADFAQVLCSQIGCTMQETSAQPAISGSFEVLYTISNPDPRILLVISQEA